MEVVVTLLSRWCSDNVRLAELLRATCALLAHRRCAEAFVAADGLPLLLALPQNPHTAGQCRKSCRSRNMPTACSSRVVCYRLCCPAV